MAHDCVMLEIPVSPLELFREGDHDALVFLRRLTRRVAATRKAENDRLERESKRR